MSFNVKIRVNKDNEMQLIKKVEKKKVLRPSDVLMSNLSLNGFVFKALIDKMQITKEPIKVDNKLLYLLPTKAVDADIEAKIIELLERKDDVNFNAYEPRMTNNKFGFQYNAENEHFEFGELSSDKSKLVAVIQVDDVVQDFLEHFIASKDGFTFVRYMSKRFILQNEIVICDNKKQITQIEEFLKKGE